jgi:hypothetical protein
MLGANQDEVGISCLTRKILRQGEDGGVRAPFRAPLELCDSVAEFELACLDVPLDLLAVFFEQDCRNGKVVTDRLDRPTGREADDAGIELRSDADGGVKHVRIRPPENQIDHPRADHVDARVGCTRSAS